MKTVTNHSSIARLYQTGKLSAEGIRQYQSGHALTEHSFRDTGAATSAYQHGMLSGQGLLAYQRGQLGHNNDPFAGMSFHRDS